MKRLIYAVIMVVALASIAHATVVMKNVRIGGPYVSPTDSYSDLTFFWTCESETLGANDYSAGDTTASKTGSISLTTSGAIIGSTSIYCSSETANFAFSTADIVPSDGDFTIAFWVSFVSSGNHYPIVLDYADSHYMYYAYLPGATGSNFPFYGIANNIIEHNAISIETPHFIQLVVCRTSSYWSITVDNVPYGQVNMASENWSSFIGLSTIKFGDAWGIGNIFYMDNIMVSSSITRDLYPLRNLTESPK